MKTFYVYYAKRLGMPALNAPESVDLSTMDKIGAVEAEDLEDLFRKMNVVDGDELPTWFKVRSMCSGDVAVDETGRGYFCCFLGWQPVAVKGR